MSRASDGCLTSKRHQAPAAISFSARSVLVMLVVSGSSGSFMVIQSTMEGLRADDNSQSAQSGRYAIAVRCHDMTSRRRSPGKSYIWAFLDRGGRSPDMPTHRCPCNSDICLCPCNCCIVVVPYIMFLSFFGFLSRTCD